MMKHLPPCFSREGGGGGWVRELTGIAVVAGSSSDPRGGTNK